MLDERQMLDASILIVDDQANNVELLSQLLSGAGYTQVHTTTVPTQVCALYAQHGFDLILLDLQMPVMDGFAVMAALQAQLGTHCLPVLVLTAQPDHKLRALQAGARDFISKPFDVAEVKTRIRNILEVQLLQRQLVEQNQQLEATVQHRTAELEASKARYRRLAELACDWHWEQDADGKLTQISGHAEDMLSPILANVGATILPVSADGKRDGDGWCCRQLEQLHHFLLNRLPFLDLVLDRLTALGLVEYYRVCGEPIFDDIGLFVGYRGTGVESAAPSSKTLNAG